MTQKKRQALPLLLGSLPLAPEFCLWREGLAGSQKQELLVMMMMMPRSVHWRAGGLPGSCWGSEKLAHTLLRACQ